MKPQHLLLSLTLLAAAGCGGGSGSVAPTSTPTSAPTSAPTTAPTNAPTAAPTASPTSVPLALHVMGGAPTTATAAQLQSVARRRAQSGTQGVANGLPVLVESSGMVATWAGDQAVWTVNAQTQANIPETGLTVTPSGALPINDPGPQPLSCATSSTAVCIVHPDAWTFGTSSANGKPVGQQTIIVTFADGTTGTTYDDVYDGWSLPCNAGWVYTSGIPVATTTESASDVYADCVNGNIDFPKGGYVLSQPSADQYGNYATILPQFTAAPIFISDTSSVSMAAVTQGMLFAIQTQDGGNAKVYFAVPPGSTALTSAQGMSLHSLSNGSFAF